MAFQYSPDKDIEFKNRLAQLLVTSAGKQLGAVIDDIIHLITEMQANKSGNSSGSLSGELQEALNQLAQNDSQTGLPPQLSGTGGNGTPIPVPGQGHGSNLMAEKMLPPDKLTLLSEAEISVLSRKIQHILRENTASEQKSGFRSGKLASSKLFKVHTNNPRIFSRRKVKKKSAYNITLLIDVSGSMMPKRFETALKSVIDTTRILNKIKGIKINTFAFADRCKQVLGYGQILDKKTQDKLKEECLNGNLGGGTYLGNAIKIVAAAMPVDNDNDSMCLVYSDGDVKYDETIQHLKHAQKKGIKMGLLEIQGSSYDINKDFDAYATVKKYEDVYPGTLKILTKFVDTFN